MSSATFAAGVDVGSTQTKAVVTDADGRIRGRALIMTGANVVAAADEAYALACRDAGVGEEEVLYVVGTGYGRYRVTFGHSQVTEISCHARGASHLFPGTSSVLDMGGQDTKAIRVGARGDVLDFCMNDKCAAGTGRFLQSAAAALEIELADLGPIALRSTRPVKISTTCTVFAESEVLSWLSRGKKLEDILMGVHHGIATRSLSLLRRVGVEPETTFTGGVARNPAMVKLIADYLGTKLNVSEESHFCGALGAALFAMDHVASARGETPAEGRPAAAAEGRVAP
jgi:predicted CoA-substrate-specific enzyme activase